MKLIVLVGLLALALSGVGSACDHYCSDCDNCESNITAASAGETVCLNANIDNYSSNCIFNPSFDNKVFDCQGNTIDGIGGTAEHHPNRIGLVSYWYLDESSGTNAEDSIGVNNGTLNNFNLLNEWYEAKVNNGLFFDGTNDYVDCGNDDSLNITDEITVEAWISAQALDSYRACIGAYKDSNNFYRIRYDHTNDKFQVVVKTGGTTKSVLSDSAPILSQGYHVAFTVNSTGTLKMYVDGVEQADTDTSVSLPPDVTVYLGTIDGSLQMFKGFIDEVSIYNRSLSSDEVFQDYASGDTSRFGVYLYNKSNVTIRNCVITDFERGIASGLGWWTQLADMSTGLQQHGFECKDGGCYAVGGGSNAETSTNHTLLYNISTNAWATHDDLPSKRQSGGLRIIGNDIIFTSGLPFSWETYNRSITIQTWAKKANAPVKKEDFALAVIDSMLWRLMGITSGLETSNTTDYYNKTSDSWTTKSQLLIKKALGDFATSYGSEEIYIVSACTYNASYPIIFPQNTVYSLNTTSEILTQKADISTARCYIEVENVDGKLVTVAGATRSNRNMINSVEYMIVEKNRWDYLLNYPLYVKSTALGSYNNQVFSTGGLYTDASVANNTYRLDLIDVSNKLNLTNNTITNCTYGIFMQYIENNTIENNTVNNNTYGIWLDSNSGNNSINNNTICSNINNDTFNDSYSTMTANFGDDNTCDNAYGWSDIGTTGCTNPCGAVDCNCSNCSDCRTKLVDASCSEVWLSDNITNESSTCISNLSNFKNKTFDCKGHVMDGNGTGYGIFMLVQDNNTIKNCVIQEFGTGIYIQASDGGDIINNSVCDNTDYDIYNVSASTYSGDNNTCDTTSNWNDTGTEGCTYICTGEVNCNFKAPAFTTRQTPRFNRVTASFTACTDFTLRAEVNYSGGSRTLDIPITGATPPSDTYVWGLAGNETCRVGYPCPAKVTIWYISGTQSGVVSQFWVKELRYGRYAGIAGLILGGGYLTGRRLRRRG